MPARDVPDHDVSDRISRGGTALVLGGGGVAGVAWESTLISEFARAGIRLQDADVVVGTSAGSVVGTALRSGGFDQWYSAQLEGAPAQAESEAGAAPFDLEPTMAAFAAVLQSADGEEATRARLGAFAVSAPTAVTPQQSLASIRALLVDPGWPEGELRITAVDATDGTFHVLDRDSDVDLAYAVAASCAVPGWFPVVPIHGRPFMDGGMRSGTNADVAADCSRILVISCGPELPASPAGPTLPTVFPRLSATADVLVIEADAESMRAFGANSLLRSTVPASVAAAKRQAAAVLEQVRSFWG